MLEMELCGIEEREDFRLEGGSADVAVGVIVPGELEEARDGGFLEVRPGEFSAADLFIFAAAQTGEVIVAMRLCQADGGGMVIDPDGLPLPMQGLHGGDREGIIDDNDKRITIELLGSGDRGVLRVIETEGFCVGIMELGEIAGQESVQVAMMEDKDAHGDRQSALCQQDGRAEPPPC